MSSTVDEFDFSKSSLISFVRPHSFVELECFNEDF